MDKTAAISSQEAAGGQVSSAAKQQKLSSEAIRNMSDFVAGAAFKEQWKFVFQEADVDVSQISDPRGLLGAILWKAEKTVRTAFGEDVTAASPGATLGVAFVEDDESLTLGARPVIIDGACESKTIPLAFSLDVLEDAVLHHERYRGEYALDHLVEEFMADRELGIIPWIDLDAPAPLDLPQIKV